MLLRYSLSAVLLITPAASGAALAQTRATLGVARTGVVKSITASDGAHVVAGQVLLTLDCAPLEREIAVRAASLDAAEFIRRFVLHVLPSGFHRIRHYGLFASGVRAHNIENARHLLAGLDSRTPSRDRRGWSRFSLIVVLARMVSPMNTGLTKRRRS